MLSIQAYFFCHGKTRGRGPTAIINLEDFQNEWPAFVTHIMLEGQDQAVIDGVLASNVTTDIPTINAAKKRPELENHISLLWDDPETDEVDPIIVKGLCNYIKADYDIFHDYQRPWFCPDPEASGTATSQSTSNKKL